MPNAFTQFLGDVAGGLFSDSGYLRDYQHAAQLYTSNYYGMAPKAGWSYFVQFGIHEAFANPKGFPEIDKKWFGKKEDIGFLVKSADLPRFTIGHDTVNQYNKKAVIQTKITYNPISITFHDDMNNLISRLWENYYRYYYSDSKTTQAPSGPQAGSQYNLQARWEAGSQYNDGAFQYGLNNGQSLPFFRYIKIFLFNRKKYNSITLINPMITEWNQGQLDNSGTKFLEAKMTFAYEAVRYENNLKSLGKNSAGSPLITDRYYDNTPSPLRSGRTQGLSGVINGAADVLDIFGQDELSLGDIIRGASAANNVYNSMQKLKGEDVGREVFGIITSSAIETYKTGGYSTNIGKNNIDLGPIADYTGNVVGAAARGVKQLAYGASAVTQIGVATALRTAQQGIEYLRAPRSVILAEPVIGLGKE